MIISRENADQYYRLMWKLHLYVNFKKKIFPEINNLEKYLKLSERDKEKVRNALWSSPDLIDAYVIDNPDNFTKDELDTINKWKLFISGQFYISRFLKGHAI